MSSPMSGERTLDKLIGYCLSHDIDTVPTTSIPAIRVGYRGHLVRVGNIAFDCHRHDTGADVRGWIIAGDEAYEFLATTFWFSSSYTFNSSKWEKGLWDTAVETAIKGLWEKVDTHKIAAQQAKELAEQAQHKSAQSVKARFEEQFR